MNGDDDDDDDDDTDGSGIYSPITASGSIVVNGIYASCFSAIKGYQAQQVIHSFIMQIYSSLEWFEENYFELKWLKGAEEGRIPHIVWGVFKLAKFVIPESLHYAYN